MRALPVPPMGKTSEPALPQDLGLAPYPVFPALPHTQSPVFFGGANLGFPWMARPGWPSAMPRHWPLRIP